MQNVETNLVNEAAAEDLVAYPSFDIQRMTNPGKNNPHQREIIRMHATSRTTYDKHYAPIGLNADGSPKPIRRTKHVRLPVTLDGVKFGTTEALWNYLLETSKYSRAPKQARRDKISR